MVKVSLCSFLTIHHWLHLETGCQARRTKAALTHKKADLNKPRNATIINLSGNQFFQITASLGLIQLLCA